MFQAFLNLISFVSDDLMCAFKFSSGKIFQVALSGDFLVLSIFLSMASLCIFWQGLFLTLV